MNWAQQIINVGLGLRKYLSRVGLCVASVMICGLAGAVKAQSTSPQTTQNNATTGKLTLKGYVRDATNGEVLIGATVRLLNLNAAVYTNEYGFYSLTAPSGTHKLVVSYIGYRADTQEVLIALFSRQVNVELTPSDKALQEVEITDEAASRNVQSAEMSQLRLSAQTVRTMPALFGEADVMRTLQLLPGVKSAGEGNSSIFVRGGNYDQNLVLIDEAPVYNPSHLLGFFSVFNSDVVRDVNLIKGGIPAQYGGRLSSVLQVRTDDGNMKRFSIRGGIGLLSSRITLEGPFKKDVAAWTVSFRRTYADLFLRLSPDPAIRSNRLWFYDLNAKVSWNIGAKDKIVLSVYHGQDYLNLNGQYQAEWGNTAGSLRWNHLFGEKMFSNLTYYFSRYDFAFRLSTAGNLVRYASGIMDNGLKYDLNYYLNDNHKFQFGGQGVVQQFRTGRVTPLNASGIQTFVMPVHYGIQIDAYAGGEHRFGRRVTLTWGLRLANFFRTGPGTVYTFGGPEGNTPTDSLKKGNLGFLGWQGGPEPRLGIRVMMHSTNSLKFSYMRTQQFVQVASNSAAALPIDLWIPTSRTIPHQIADQLALGFFQNLANNQYEISIEGYMRWLQNQIEFKRDAQIFFNRYYEAEFFFGKGWAYGMEVLFRKAKGKTTGWVGYTLAWSQRQFDQLNGGRIFNARNDRRHEISVVLNQEIGKRVILNATWVYATGLPISLPNTKYQIGGAVLGVYEGRYGYRLPDYHRLDLSCNIEHKNTKRWKSSWNISIYNVYARRNPWSIVLEPSQDGTQQQAYKTYLFTIVPSLTYNFRF